MINGPLSHELRDLYPIAEEIPKTISNENNGTQNIIDFILVYDIDSFERAQKAMRKNFEANLQHYGLILKYRKVSLKNQRQRVFVFILLLLMIPIIMMMTMAVLYCVVCL